MQQSRLAKTTAQVLDQSLLNNQGESLRENNKQGCLLLRATTAWMQEVEQRRSPCQGAEIGA